MLRKESLKLLSKEVRDFYDPDPYSEIKFALGPRITKRYLEHYGNHAISEGIEHGVLTVEFTEDEADVSCVWIIPVYRDYGEEIEDAAILAPKEYMHLRTYFFEIVNRLSH